MVKRDSQVNLVCQLIKRIEHERRQVVIIGDSMIDRWVYGHIEKCQDNCQKLITDHVYMTPGGADNACNSLRNWSGINTNVYSYYSHNCSYSSSSEWRIVKTRFIVDDKIMFRWDEEVYPLQSSCEWKRREAVEMIYFADGVLLSDYDKGFLLQEFIRVIIDLCKSRGIPCVIDAKRRPGLYKGAILKYNEQYASKWKCKLGVCTQGHKPPIIGGGLPISRNLPPVECVNHVGAGDCFASHLTLALAYNFSLEEASIIAHSAGRVYVQYKCNQAPEVQEIVEDLDKESYAV